MSLQTLLCVAPFTDINSPYASTAYLSGFLQQQNYRVAQADLSIELFTALLSAEGLTRVARALKRANPRARSFFTRHSDALIPKTEAALRFLQGLEPALIAPLVEEMAMENYFPSIPRITDSWWAGEQILSHARRGRGLNDLFETLTPLERARYQATRHVYGMVAALAEEATLRLDLMLYPTIKGYPQFKLAMTTFDGLLGHLDAPPSVVDELLEERLRAHLSTHAPALVGISAPFTSTAYGAFRMAKVVRQVLPQVKIVLGGGFPSTELRGLNDPRVFDFFDFVVLDDGERPILRILEHLEGKTPADRLLRTLVREGGKVILKSNPTDHDIPRKECGTPYYLDLPMESYVPVLESLSACAMRNFQNFTMNKMTLAQGCYWKRCTFCDVSLAYIDRYDPSTADVLIDQLERIARETGRTAFHFVDEAMPPKLLRALSLRLIERGMKIEWLGMMRFDQAFDSDLPELMAKAGCLSVFCGLEVASERMFRVVDKGVTLEQVARVSRRLSDAGLMVHAYLMYGYPLETAQDTVDSVEFVRQLFENGCIHSGVWSRFSLTAHSPIGLNPEKYGIRILSEAGERGRAPVAEERRFCRNALVFEEPARELDPGCFTAGLERSLRYFMHGLGFERDVRDWFEGEGMRLPPPGIPKDFVARQRDARSREMRSAT